MCITPYPGRAVWLSEKGSDIMSLTSHKEELKERVKAKKTKLQHRLEFIRAQAYDKKNEEAEKIEKSLNDLNENLKDGWDNLTEQAASKLNDWLKEN